MKIFRSSLSCFLAAALVHASAAPLFAAGFELVKPLEAPVAGPTVAVEDPAIPGALDLAEPMLPGAPALNAAEPLVPASAVSISPAQARAAEPFQPGALAALRVATGELAKAPANDPIAANAVISRVIEGSRVSAKADAPVTGSWSSSGSVPLVRPAANVRPAASITRRKIDHERGSARTAVVVIIGIVAAVALTLGILWHSAQKKNETWQGSKSNQEIVLVERARRAGDAASLQKLAQDARSREARMNERIADAQSEGSKKVDDKTGDSMGQARFYSAADGLVAARAEMNLNAVSQDPSQRIGEQMPSSWKQRLADQEGQAKGSAFEGTLALSLQQMKAELGREDAKDKSLAGDIATFHKEVPGAFKGRMGDMEKRAQGDLNEFESTEVQPEHSLYDQYNNAMRARVSSKLAAQSKEFQAHASRLERLSAAQREISPAVQMAGEIDKALADMSSYRHQELVDLAMATQEEGQPIYDDNGKKIGEKDGALWKTMAASARAQADASAATARAKIEALNSILPLLRDNPTLQQEGLTDGLPADQHTSVGDGDSGVFFDFFLPATWSFFGSAWTQDQANEARGAFGPVRGALDSVNSQLGKRQQRESGWVNQAIDKDLNAQMANVPATSK